MEWFRDTETIEKPLSLKAEPSLNRFMFCFISRIDYTSLTEKQTTIHVELHTKTPNGSDALC